MIDKIKALLQEVENMKAANADELEALRIKYLSKKGEISMLMNDFRNVAADQKRDVIGFLNHKITVNIITNGKISEKKTLHLPKKLTNVIHCKNPRCITSIEQELPNVFLLTDPETATYRCQYCEEKYTK